VLGVQFIPVIDQSALEASRSLQHDRIVYHAVLEQTRCHISAKKAPFDHARDAWRIIVSSATAPIGDGPDSLSGHLPFELFWLARVGAAIASQMQAVALGWQAYAMTGSAFYLGLVGFAQFLPLFLLTLVVGHVVDRYDRRLIGSVSMAVQAIAAAGLAYGSAVGSLTKGNLLAAVFLIGAAQAFQGPTMQALLPGLVPSSLFPRAVAWSMSAFQTATILGPALGGLLYAAGPAMVYSVAAMTFFAASILLAAIRVERSPLKREPAGLQSLFAGIGFIRRRRVIFGAISLDLFAVLLGGATALLPIYAKDLLRTGPWGLGILRSAPAVGALAMSVVLARRPLRHRVGRTMMGAVGLFGVGTIVFAVSRSLVLSLAALAILGAMDVVSMVVRHSLVQIETPDEMRGRVSAVHSMCSGTSNQLGEFESGVTAAWFGPVPATVIGGIGTLLVVLLWSRLFPELLHVDSLERPSTPSAHS
jgi:MFS family permease